MATQDFDGRIRDAASFISSLSSSDPVRIIAHLDADGICAAAIMIKALSRAGIESDASIMEQISHDALRALPDEPTIFVDAGASHLDTIADIFSSNVLIVDHHRPVDIELPDNIMMLNPLLFGIDGGREACSASVAYALALAMDAKNKELSALAVVGIIADSQEKGGIVGFNNRALDDSKDTGLVRVERGLRLYGAETRSVAKLLAQSYDLKVPGITGDLRGAKELLRSLDIIERDDGNWRKWADLDDVERKKIVDAIVDLAEGDKEKLFVDHYALVREPHGPTRDARQFATLLNACGRLELGMLGLDIALGDEEALKRADSVLFDYKRTLNDAMRWYEDARSSEYVEEGQGFVLINAQDNILPAIAGTLCSMIVRGSMVPRGTTVVALARYENGTTKISMRCVGGPDMDALLADLVAIVGGESGGHDSAAGGVIPTDSEEDFLAAAREALSRYQSS